MNKDKFDILRNALILSNALNEVINAADSFTMDGLTEEEMITLGNLCAKADKALTEVINKEMEW